VSVADPGDHRELDDPYSAGAPLVTIEHTASEEATVTDEKEEGWYTDPFGQHEARWMSAGTPTKLVRDRGVESYDDPPDVEPTQVPKRIVSEPPPGTDIRRADQAEAEHQPTGGDIAGAAVFGALSSWHRHPQNPDR
jgi:hypothetical protein